jgi:predicted ArsR family transcriptional regulator
VRAETKAAMDDWLASTVKTEDVGETADELATRWQVTIKAARERLQMLSAAGKLTVGQRTVTRIDGRRCCVPVYVVTLGKKTTL